MLRDIVEVACLPELPGQDPGQFGLVSITYTASVKLLQLLANYSFISKLVFFLVLEIVLMTVLFLVLKIVLFSGAQDCAHDCAFSGAQCCADDCAFSGAQFCAHQHLLKVPALPPPPPQP